MGDRRWKLSKSQRMQIKAFICLLGFLLLAVLLFGKLVLLLVHREEPEPHIPVIRQLANVWIMEVDEEGLLLFRDGERERYPWGALPADGDGLPADAEEDGQERVFRADPSVREQVADVTLTDGAVTALEVKADKINGKIYSADSSCIEVEGYGRLPLAADYRGYRLFDSLEMCTVNDIYFGYAFTDLCIEDGEVCAILMAKEEVMEYVRVLVKASDYSGGFHDRPVVTCDVDFTVIYGPYGEMRRESRKAGEELEFGRDSAYFETDRVWVVPDVLTGKVILKNCGRSQGTPAYRGQMEFLRTAEGIVAINEVLLEEYLYSVVPSEMPASYPFEALKAQAVCARTYAYGCMLRAGYPQYGAHMDDSTSYQVYNNILEQESTTTAVKETYGKLLYTEAGKLAGTYYYSTSCGIGTDANVWKTEAAPALTYLRGKPLSKSAMAEAIAVSGGVGGDTAAGPGSAQENGGLGERLREEESFAAFISVKNEDDFEAGENLYRWSYSVEELDKNVMLERLQKRYAGTSGQVLTWNGEEYVSEAVTELGDVTELYIEKRGSGGVADELVIQTADRKIKVISEQSIRYVLNDGKTKVLTQNGGKMSSAVLLPSGFFVIEADKADGIVTGYTLAGGGFGHGVGMSQNGAKQMANSGYTAEQILLYFYENCLLRGLYEQE